jgi:hypothetical protein
VRKAVVAVGTEQALVFTAFVTIWLVAVTARQEKAGNTSPIRKRVNCPYRDFRNWWPKLAGRIAFPQLTRYAIASLLLSAAIVWPELNVPAVFEVHWFSGY